MALKKWPNRRKPRKGIPIWPKKMAKQEEMNMEKSYKEQAGALVAQMTLDEKIDMLSGASLFAMNGNERLGLPEYPVSDGPHGVKLLKFGPDGMPKKAGHVTCFPTACAAANSWDRGLVYKLGETLGQEAQLEGTGVSLSPAVNIKRHPLCGRNFEYYSEDPYLAGELGTQAVKGVQSQGMPVSLKHFALNNQEYRRTTIDEIIDERTFHEIYLAVFERIVKKAHPRSVMCAYNSINGCFSAENKMLLTDILRDDWGFDGMVMSDWGAVHDRVASIKAGMDLEMPGGMHIFDEQIRDALADGSLTQDEVDLCVKRIVAFILYIKENKKPEGEIDHKTHHALAQDMAQECMVLLKNDGILPLKAGTLPGKTAVIGSLAKDIRYQGGGSSTVLNETCDVPLEEILTFEPVSYTDGYDCLKTQGDPDMEQEAVSLASSCDRVIYFMGLTYGYESEDYDRYDMKLPQNQTQLLEKLYQVNKNIVVVMCGGSAVEMDWDENVRAVLYASLAGEGAGAAIARLLYGQANPCGKLAETFPQCLEHTPAYLSYPGRDGKTFYSEGLYVGYRYYEKKKLPPKYPFGFGLSYTSFEYKELTVDKTSLTDDEALTVTCKVKNTGTVEGKEILQVYVKDVLSTVDRPEKELKGFEKVSLKPGEEKTVTFVLDRSAFAYYEKRVSGWHVESGDFEILVGASSQDIRLRTTVTVKGTKKIPNKYTRDTLMIELKNDSFAYSYMKELTKDMPAAQLPGYDHPVGPMGMDKVKQREGMRMEKLAQGDGATPAFLTDQQLDEVLKKLNDNQ